MDICRKIFGTTDEEELRRIAEKARRYDELLQNMPKINTRNAGRKPRFTPEEIRQIGAMREEGQEVQQIATYFGTSRQTIFKYLQLVEKGRKKHVTMTMNYMLDDQLCTVIDIDFRNERIYIENRCDDFLHCAFGVNKMPTWEDFQEFLESRCFPKTRAGIKDILRDIGLDTYEPLQIVEKTQGRMAEDHQWIDIVYHEA